MFPSNTNFNTTAGVWQHLSTIARNENAASNASAKQFFRDFRTLQKCGYDISRAWAVLHQTEEDVPAERALNAAARRERLRGFKSTVAPPSVNLELKSLQSAESQTEEEEDGESWAVIVAGDEADRYDFFNVEVVFEMCVRQLGRDKVIFIANLDEIHQKRRAAAATGVPVFSPRLSSAENLRQNQLRLANFEHKFRFILENGGADYDYDEVSTDTVPSAHRYTSTRSSLRFCGCWAASPVSLGTKLSPMRVDAFDRLQSD